MNTTPTETMRKRAGGVMRRLVALALVLWLGGVMCLVGCERDVFAATAVESSGAGALQDTGEGASCPLSAGHDCCRAKVSRDGQPSVETPTRSLPLTRCCPLAGQTAEQVRKAGIVDAPAAITSHVLPFISGVETLPASFLSGQRRVPDRGGTYLRCCVFLI